MRIAIIGQQDFGKAVLKACIDRGDSVTGVFCAPEKPGAKSDSLRVAAEAARIAVYQMVSLKTDEAREAQDLARPDAEAHVLHRFHHASLGEEAGAKSFHVEQRIRRQSHRCSLGLSTSRIWSATRLMLTIVSNKATPGKKLIQYLPESKY